jgi:hypothetical protein
MPSNVPIALFAYNRPEHLQQTLAGLRNNRPPLIYAFADAPKKPEHRPAVEAVKMLLSQVDWCKIEIIQREHNLGLGTSIRQGISQVLKEHEQVIVVEDDIVLRPGAYAYTVAALQHYKDSPVMTISMWSHPNLVPKGIRDGFFSKRFVCWGWATYRSAWETYQGTPLEIYRQCQEENLDILSWGNDLKWQAENAAERNLWYVGYALTHFIQKGISFFPTNSLTTNIGFDGSGQNSSIRWQKSNQLVNIPESLPQQWPKIYLHPETAKKFFNYFKLARPFPGRRRILNLLRMVQRKLMGR